MTTGSVNPRRADTRRNHDAILNVAARSLACSERISFNDIAKQAGVGVGTVYRHFPTSEALIIAVYRRELEHLGEVVPKLLAEHDPEQAFRTWVTDHLAHYMMTKRGLAKALGAVTSAPAELPVNAHDTLIDALTTLLQANVEPGNIRPDLNPETILRGLGGLFYLNPKGDWRTETAELIDLLWRGMSV